MLRAAIGALVSVGVLAGCAGESALKPSDLPITGALAYRERIALPPDSVAVVELREAGASAPIAVQRRVLAGRQVPIPFALSARRPALVAGKTYSVRGSIEQDGEVKWLSAAAPIDPQQAAVGLGTLTLLAVQGEAPQMFSWRCGDQLIQTEQFGDKLRLQLGDAQYHLLQAETASGARYVTVDDPTTLFWSKGERARLTIRGHAYSECVRADTATVAFRAGGNEPGWQLEMGVRTLFTTADGKTRIESPTPVAESIASVRRYAVAPNLQVTVSPRLCVDSMSGLPRPDTVSVVLDGRTLRGCGGDPASLLQGGEWVVEDIGGAGMVDGSRATLNFDADGQLSGSASCNRYSGSYHLSGEGLSMSSKTAMTLMACVPTLMQQESRFMQLLSQVRRFRFGADGALILETDGGGTVTARR
ncbi:META domain-containing protein [Thiobacillus sp.]|uniref:META domain-containing protein n=1 Tax=Thiobacillus sp. TaxID=924 RepID=UPI00286D6C28|nr:META domain-containing protein [Thiobacillus sp.]